MLHNWMQIKSILFLILNIVFWFVRIESFVKQSKKLLVVVNSLFNETLFSHVFCQINFLLLFQGLNLLIDRNLWCRLCSFLEECSKSFEIKLTILVLDSLVSLIRLFLWWTCIIFRLIGVFHFYSLNKILWILFCVKTLKKLFIL